MKRKELNQLKSQSIDEIKKKLKERQKEKTEELINLKMGKTKDVHAISKIRKDIAQLKTIISFNTLSSHMKKNKNLNKETEHATG